MENKIENKVMKAYKAFRALQMMPQRRRMRRGNREIFKTRQSTGFFSSGFGVLKEKHPDFFKKSVRMDISLFNVLLELTKFDMSKLSNRKPIDPEQRLFVTLYFLAHGCSIHTLAMKFRLGHTTVRQIILETSDIIWKKLSPFYMSNPNANEWQTICKGYEEKWGLPHCFGALDGKHINIVCPPNAGSQYFNYKKHHSVVLLAMCDSDYIFTFVDVGAYGSQSDGGIFQHSKMGKKLADNQLNLPFDDNLPNSNIKFPYFCVADAAFPLKRYIMKPFAKFAHCPQKKHYNTKISQARISIEIAFGILSARWRILRTIINMHPKNVKKLVLATTVLHNFLRLHKVLENKEITDLGDTVMEQVTTQEVRIGNNASRESLALRNILCDYLNTNN